MRYVFFGVQNARYIGRFDNQFCEQNFARALKFETKLQHFCRGSIRDNGR